MKKFLKSFLISIFSLSILISPSLIPLRAASLAQKLSGKFLLQVESHGECFYVNPLSQARVYLGRPADAFRLMREYSLGISENNYNSFKSKAPERLAGRFLMRSQAKGEAYYVEPNSLKLIYLGRPADAFMLMRQHSLGITNKDLAQIPVEISTPISNSNPQNEITNLEQIIFDQINAYREEHDLKTLNRNDFMSAVARAHSQDMAAARTEVGHDGFEDRFATVRTKISITAFAENVAYNYGYTDPAGQAVRGWIASPGHLENLTGNYNLTGIGAAKDKSGAYYFTQVFAK